MMFSYWLVVGSPENWRTAFEHGNIWGLKETQRHLWESLEENDMLLFYATRPVGGIIGYGSVRTKFRQKQPLWPQEFKQSKVVWPLRFEFDVGYCLPPEKWATQKLVSKELWPRGGFQLLTENIGQQLVSAFKMPGKLVQPPMHPRVEEPLAQHDHDAIKEALVEIGKLQNLIAESEYQFDLGRLDVVWRRVQQSVPTYVFEIQIGGNIYQALAKLKHAFDLWNSHLFLVSPQDDFSKALELLSGTFHEIRGRLKFIDCLRVKELLAHKKRYHELEKELGII